MIKNLDRKWQKYISDMLKKFWILPMESKKKSNRWLKKCLTDIWYSEKYYAKVKEIVP